MTHGNGEDWAVGGRNAEGILYFGEFEGTPSEADGTCAEAHVRGGDHQILGGETAVPVGVIPFLASADEDHRAGVVEDIELAAFDCVSERGWDFVVVGTETHQLLRLIRNPLE